MFSSILERFYQRVAAREINNHLALDEHSVKLRNFRGGSLSRYLLAPAGGPKFWTSHAIRLVCIFALVVLVVGIGANIAGLFLGVTPSASTLTFVPINVLVVAYVIRTQWRNYLSQRLPTSIANAAIAELAHRLGRIERAQSMFREGVNGQYWKVTGPSGRRLIYRDDDDYVQFMVAETHTPRQDTAPKARTAPVPNEKESGLLFVKQMEDEFAKFTGTLTGTLLAEWTVLKEDRLPELREKAMRAEELLTTGLIEDQELAAQIRRDLHSAAFGIRKAVKNIVEQQLRDETLATSALRTFIGERYPVSPEEQAEFEQEFATQTAEASALDAERIRRKAMLDTHGIFTTVFESEETMQWYRREMAMIARTSEITGEHAESLPVFARKIGVGEIALAEASSAALAEDGKVAVVGGVIAARHGLNLLTADATKPTDRDGQAYLLTGKLQGEPEAKPAPDGSSARAETIAEMIESASAFAADLIEQLERGQKMTATGRDRVAGIARRILVEREQFKRLFEQSFSRDGGDYYDIRPLHEVLNRVDQLLSELRSTAERLGRDDG